MSEDILKLHDLIAKYYHLMVINENYSISDVCAYISKNYLYHNRSVEYHIKEYFPYMIKKNDKNKRLSLIYYYGGKCMCCGENRIYLLEFHHIDKLMKSFGLDKTSIENLTLKEVFLEANPKCILCCHNCHVEIHMGLREIPKNINTHNFGWLPIYKFENYIGQ